MKNNVIVAIAVALAVILIGGSVALVIMLRDKTPTANPFDYISKDCTFFMQFDTHMNGQELTNQISPWVSMLGGMMDDGASEFLRFDYSFMDIAGFVAMNSSTDKPDENIFGLRLSGKGNPQKKVDELFSMIKSVDDSIEIKYDDDGFIRVDDAVVLYVDKEYILFAPDVGTIQGALAVRDEKRKPITAHPDWEEIEKTMTSPEFSFFGQIPTDNETISVTGTYFKKDRNEVGLEITLIGGRDKLKNAFDDEEAAKIMEVVDGFFDNATDLSEIISKLPTSSIRGAISAIPNFNSDMDDETEKIFDGLLGVWFDGIDTMEDIRIGTLIEPDNMSIEQTITKLFPSDEFTLKQISGGTAVYKKDTEWRKDPIFAGDELEDNPDAYIKDDPENLVVVSDEKMLDEVWIPVPASKTTKSALYFIFDYSILVEQIAELEELQESGAMFGASMVEEILKQANIFMVVNIFENKPHLKFQITLTGNLEKLNSFGDLLFP